jgi:hypothetical protein
MSTLQSHVSRSFKTQEPIDQTLTGAKVVTGLTNNASIFTSPPMTPTAYEIINNAYAGKISAASRGDTAAIALRISYFDLTWLPATESLADYVDTTSGNNPSTIILSGFDATKSSTEAHVKPVVMVPGRHRGA